MHLLFMNVYEHESEWKNSSNLYGSIASWATNQFSSGQQKELLEVRRGYFNVCPSYVEHKKSHVGWKSHNDDNDSARWHIL